VEEWSGDARRKEATLIWIRCQKKIPYISSVKAVALLLSTYLFLLACLTCGDWAAENSLELGSSMLSHADQHKHGDHGDEDGEGHADCSPFCFCACCGISIAETQVDPVLVFTKVEEIARTICHFEPNRLEGLVPPPPTHPPIV